MGTDHGLVGPHIFIDFHDVVFCRRPSPHRYGAAIHTYTTAEGQATLRGNTHVGVHVLLVRMWVRMRMVQGIGTNSLELEQ